MDGKEKTNMTSATVLYVTIIFVLLRIGKCPAQLRLTKGPMSGQSAVRALYLIEQMLSVLPVTTAPTHCSGLHVCNRTEQLHLCSFFSNFTL